MRRNVKYFSYKQLSLWESSPRGYWQQYGLGEEGYDSEAMSKGRMFMDFLQFGFCDDPDPLLPSVVKRVDVLEIIEERVEYDLEISKGYSVPLLSYFDSSTLAHDYIFEYKTGRVPWTQEGVDKNEQLLFYGAINYLKYEVNPGFSLYWVQTEVNEFGELVYTGEVERFDTVFTVAEIKKMVNRIKSAIVEIDDYQYTEIILNNDLVNAYLDLVKKKNEAEGKLAMLKNEIDNNIFDSGEQYGVSEQGIFTVITRKDGNKYTRFTEHRTKL